MIPANLDVDLFRKSELYFRALLSFRWCGELSCEESHHSCEVAGVSLYWEGGRELGSVHTGGPREQNQFNRGTSLAVQWSGLRASTAEGPGSIPGPGTRIPQAAWHGQKTPI